MMLSRHTGELVIKQAVVIETPDSEAGRRIGATLAGYIKAGSGIQASVSSTTDQRATIRLQLEPQSNLGREGYTLTINPQRIRLSAGSPAGLFWGVQTLRQLIGTADQPAREGVLRLPALRIADQPRYAWRGMHLDVCRHIFPLEYIKQYIDLLALHKLNVFHWHLTEDQGWRIEIKKYPKLMSVAAWSERDGKRYGGFYTQDQVREIVQYAADRFITVVPEIEMPGHATAALAAYPEYSCKGGPIEVLRGWGITDDIYCAGKDETFTFLQDVLSEVLALFPSRYIHIGGDEVPKKRWQACPRCQARIRSEGLKDEDELQSYFIQRIGRFLTAHNRILVGWDEILEGGLADDAVVMSWRNEQGGIAAARMGHDVVMSPIQTCYFNLRQLPDPDEPGFPWQRAITLRDVYTYDPTPAALTPEEARHVLGAQGNLWSEYIATPDEASYMALPRMSALAEVTWTPHRRLGWKSFLRRLDQHVAWFDALGVKYSRAALEQAKKEK